jgi:hypothetical protein
MKQQAPEYPEYTVKWSRYVTLTDRDGNPVDDPFEGHRAACYARTTINGQTAAATAMIDRERLDRIGQDEAAQELAPSIRAAFENLRA